MTTRYRCSACGNRTRFDVVSTRRTRAFHHFELSGIGHVEEEEVLSLEIESVVCRWCQRSDAIESIDEDEPITNRDVASHVAS